MAAITLVTGALFLLLAVLRLGWIARFLSRAVVTGFLAGAAVDVVIGELPKLTGTSTSGDNAWARARVVDPVARRHQLDDAARRAGGARGHPRPALLRPARAGRARARRRRAARDVRCSTSARTASRSSATCRAACPRRRCRALDVFQQHYATILAAAAGLLLIGFSQTAGDARAFAVRHRYRIDVNQESVAQGMANAASGVVPGDAGLDEPVGELAQRVGRRPQRRWRRSSPAGS